VVKLYWFLSCIICKMQLQNTCRAMSLENFLNNTYADNDEYGLLRLQLQEVAAEASLSATMFD